MVTRFRIVLLVVLIAAAAFLVGYFVYDQINKKLASDSTVIAENAEELYGKWQAESDVTKKASIEKDLLDQVGKVISRYPHQYGAQRGLFVRAELYYNKKTWDPALADYRALAARFPKSYLAPISLFNGAVCLEEKGDAENAEKLYVQAYTNYKDSTVAPRAIFNAGRLDEAKGAWADAQKKYEQMDGLYSQSVWTKLAKNRLVELKVRGKTK
jgi:tetratricopeptide (TPR) repeat protein